MSESTRIRVVVDAAGLVGVLVGLVFVGLQIQQNTAATRAQTQQAIFDGTLQQHWGVIANEQLREAMVHARDDPSWVSATPQTADHLLLERFYWQRFNGLENVYYHHVEGTLDSRLWSGWEGWIRDVGADPLMPYYWRELRSGYMAEFVEYIDAILSHDGNP